MVERRSMDGSSPIHVFQFKLPKHSVSHE